jgi:hypothetical protein
MNTSPLLAEHRKRFIESVTDPGDGSSRVSVILAKLYRPVRTVQVEERFAASAQDMHMSRSMVGRIDDDPESFKSQDRQDL